MSHSRRVLGKRFNLFIRRPQTRKVEIHPLDQRPRIGLHRRCELFPFELGQDKAIDPLPRPVLSPDRRSRRFNDWLKSPPSAPAFDVRSSLGHLARRPTLIPRIRRPHANPLLELLHLLRAQLLLRRHLKVFITPRNCSEKPTPFWIPRHNNRPILPTLRDPLPRVDRKSTRLNSSHGYISYAVFCLKKKK